MPLVKSSSPEAWKANLKAEIASGKPQKQALAIAYSIQRRAGRADGGRTDYRSSGMLENVQRGKNAFVDEAIEDYNSPQRYVIEPSLGEIQSREWDVPLGTNINDAGQIRDSMGELEYIPRPRILPWASVPKANSEGEIVGRKTIPVMPKIFDVLPGRQRSPIRRAAGGDIPWFARQEARDMNHYGMVHGATPGRADMRPTGVRGGSYVVPADIVSGLGQGNSLAGANALNRMFKMGPYGTQAPAMPGINKTSKSIRQRFAGGGDVPIKVSDGEFLIPPEKVAEIGAGDLDHGHEILDKLVELKRQETIRHLASLPPPRDSAMEQRADGGDVDNQPFDMANTDDSQQSFDDSLIPQRKEITPDMNWIREKNESVRGYGMNPEYSRRMLGVRNPSIFGYD